MEITEVKVFLKDSEDKKLKAYVTITFDDAFVVRDLKIIDGSQGLFVAMPSRKLKESCPKCRGKNAFKSRYCSSCGVLLLRDSGGDADSGTHSNHRDIAHPITVKAREYIQTKVLEVYAEELRKKSCSSEIYAFS